MPGLPDQTRYLTLRQRLASLGYKSAVFSTDSMDIVEHLLNDLTTTAEAYETLQLKDQRLTQDLALAQSQLFPLRKENARLARENYQVFFFILRSIVFTHLADSCGDDFKNGSGERFDIGAPRHH